MSDPRQEFLDVLERALQYVPHFTTPTTVPSDMSWGTFFDSSEILAAWLALDEKDRVDSVIAAVTGYINRVNEMATEGKELCARVALQFGDEKRAAGLYGVTPAAVGGGTLPPLQLVPRSEEDGGEGHGEQSEANEPTGAGVEPPDLDSMDIGAALRARYPGVPAIDHAALDDAVDLLQEAARAVAAGIDLDTMLQAAAELDEPEGDGAEADHGEVRAGFAPGYPAPDLTAGLVHAAETAREASDLLHAAAMRLDAYSRMAGTGTTAAIEPELGDSEPLDPDLEATPQPERNAGPEASASAESRASAQPGTEPGAESDVAVRILLALQARYAAFEHVDRVAWDEILEDLRFQLRDHLAPAPDFDDPAEAILLALQARYAEFRDVDNDTFVAMLRDLRSLWGTPDPGPGFESDLESDLERETVAQPGTQADPGSRTSGHVSDVEAAPEPDTATSAESVSGAATMTDPETSSRPIIVIDATWSEPEPTASSKTRGAYTTRSPKAEPPTGLSADISRYVPRWQLHLVATAAITMAIVAVVLWTSDPSPSGPAPLAPSQPQSTEPQTVGVEPPTTPATPEEHLVPLPPTAPEIAPSSEGGTEAVVSSEQPSRAIIGEMDHSDEPVAERSGEDKPGKAVASDRQRSKPLPIPARDRDPDRQPVSEIPRQQVPALPAPMFVEPALKGMKLQVSMGVTVSIDQGANTTPLILSVRRAPEDDNVVPDTVQRPDIVPEDIARLPRTTEQHEIEWRDAHGVARIEVAGQ